MWQLHLPSPLALLAVEPSLLEDLIPPPGIASAGTTPAEAAPTEAAPESRASSAATTAKAGTATTTYSC